MATGAHPQQAVKLSGSGARADVFYRRPIHQWGLPCYNVRLDTERRSALLLNSDANRRNPNSMKESFMAVGYIKPRTRLRLVKRERSPRQESAIRARVLSLLSAELNNKKNHASMRKSAY